MFYSILYPTKEQAERPREHREPEYFQDLHLDHIFNFLLTEEKGFGRRVKKDFGLESVFYTPVRDPDVILYRQEVLRELEDENIRAVIAAFAAEVFAVGLILKGIREALDSLEKERDNYMTRGQLIHCVERYCHMISSFTQKITALDFHSRGLRGFAAYLKAYAASDKFQTMCRQFQNLRQRLSEVRFCMLIKNDTIRVRPYEGQKEHAEELLALFSRFKQDEAEETYTSKQTFAPLDWRLEIEVLKLVAEAHKDIFRSLDKFCLQYANFQDETILRFCQEVHFYLLWLDFIAPMRKLNLPFCYPQMQADASHLYAYDTYDLALAHMHSSENKPVVPNDFALKAPEQILVITGANQGGKTTFARTFGQLHYLASLGLCVPGRKAALLLFDKILTHFEREEDLTELSGKLQDDLLRLHRLLQQATAKSIIIINEIFSSTTLSDALNLGRKMMDALLQLGAPAVVVTFLDELATHGPQTVSMVSMVRDDGSAERTYKIVRRPPDGLAYALTLIKKHGLTYEQLAGRLAP